MTILVKLVATAALLLTVVPSVLVAAGRLPPDTHKTLMLIGTALWFVGVPLARRERDRRSGS